MSVPLPQICSPNGIKMCYWSLHLQRKDCPKIFTHHSNGQVRSSALISWTVMEEEEGGWRWRWREVGLDHL